MLLGKIRAKVGNFLEMREKSDKKAEIYEKDNEELLFTRKLLNGIFPYGFVRSGWGLR